MKSTKSKNNLSQRDKAIKLTEKEEQDRQDLKRAKRVAKYHSYFKALTKGMV